MGCSWHMHNVRLYLYPYYDIENHETKSSGVNTSSNPQVFLTFQEWLTVQYSTAICDSVTYKHFYTQIWNRQRIMPSDCFFIHHNILDVSKMVNVSVVDNLCVAYQCSIAFCKWTWYGSCVLIFRVAWWFILLPNISERCLICHYACLRIIEQSLTMDPCLVRRVQYVWIGQAILILYLFRCKLECSGMINEYI